MSETVDSPLVWAVVGAGHGGLAMAGHLSLMGQEVRLFNRTDSKLEGVRWHGGLKVRGEVNGFAPIGIATSDLGEAIRGVQIIMIVTPATAHRDLARKLAPIVEPGQLIVLNPGRTGGALEFRRVLDTAGCRVPILLAETQTFLYAARAKSRFEVSILRIKDQVPLATLPAHHIPRVLNLFRPIFPQFVAGTNVLSTSLENIGAIFHPALTIMNAGWIEATSGRFEYYLDGITPSVARVLETIDHERLEVARALGVRSHSARDWLYLSYGSRGTNLRQAVLDTGAYRGIQAPSDIQHRYIFEDVPMSLVPLASLGKALGIPTPGINLIIDLANLMHQKDYRAEGRTVESLGLAGLSVKQIVQLVVGSSQSVKEMP